MVSRRGGQISAEFHLYEVRGGREVLTRTYADAPRSLRAIAHRFADDIVKHYTGEPGVFQTRIAFVRKQRGARDVMVCDVDGKNATVVYADRGLNLLPSWNPRGSDLLFTSYRGRRPELWSLPLGGGTPRKIAGFGDLTTGGAYSPDGRRIAFASSSNGNSEIWVASADGSNPKQLTRDPATDTSPTWSPDGNRIAFVSTRAGNPHIYLMGADGSNPRRLTFQGNYNQTPQWSPRGDQIAFTARDERNVFDVFTVSPDNGKIARVTQDQGNNEEPSWAPNGRLLVFSTTRTGRAQLVISTPNGDRQKIVTSDPGEQLTPSWGPLP